MAESGGGRLPFSGALMLIVFVLGFQVVDFFGDILLSSRLLSVNERDFENRRLLRP